MKVLTKNRLELHWAGVSYQEGVALLEGAYFSGPVLKDTAQLRENDQLTLDMTAQHKVYLPEYYQAALHWGSVTYKGDQIFLAGAKIIGKYVNSLDTLRPTDWILIDCDKHDERRHPYNLVYFSKVMKKEGDDKY